MLAVHARLLQNVVVIWVSTVRPNGSEVSLQSCVYLWHLCHGLIQCKSMTRTMTSVLLQPNASRCMTRNMCCTG